MVTPVFVIDNAVFQCFQSGVCIGNFRTAFQNTADIYHIGITFRFIISAEVISVVDTSDNGSKF